MYHRLLRHTACDKDSISNQWGKMDLLKIGGTTSSHFGGGKKKIKLNTYIRHRKKAKDTSESN